MPHKPNNAKKSGELNGMRLIQKDIKSLPEKEKRNGKLGKKLNY